MRPLRVPRLQTLPTYLKRLHESRDMPQQVYDATLCSVCNDIAHIMRWRFVPLIRYEQVIERIVLTGFPMKTYPNYYRINERQVRYLLHKMGYTHAKIYSGSSGDYKLVLQRRKLKHGREGHYTHVERIDPFREKRHAREHDIHDPVKHEHNYENILTEIDREADYETRPPHERPPRP